MQASELGLADSPPAATGPVAPSNRHVGLWRRTPPPAILFASVHVQHGPASLGSGAGPPGPPLATPRRTAGALKTSGRRGGGAGRPPAPRPHRQRRPARARPQTVLPPPARLARRRRRPARRGMTTWTRSGRCLTTFGRWRPALGACRTATMSTASPGGRCTPSRTGTRKRRSVRGSAPPSSGKIKNLRKLSLRKKPTMGTPSCTGPAGSGCPWRRRRSTGSLCPERMNSAFGTSSSTTMVPSRRLARGSS